MADHVCASVPVLGCGYAYNLYSVDRLPDYHGAFPGSWDCMGLCACVCLTDKFCIKCR